MIVWSHQFIPFSRILWRHFESASFCSGWLIRSLEFLPCRDFNPLSENVTESTVNKWFLFSAYFTQLSGYILYKKADPTATLVCLFVCTSLPDNRGRGYQRCRLHPSSSPLTHTHSCTHQSPPTQPTLTHSLLSPVFYSQPHLASLNSSSEWRTKIPGWLKRWFGSCDPSFKKISKWQIKSRVKINHHSRLLRKLIPLTYLMELISRCHWFDLM